MREEQIENIIDMLEAVWKDNATMTFGQLVTEPLYGTTLQHTPDSQFGLRMKEYYQDLLGGFNENIERDRTELQKKFDEVTAKLIAGWDTELNEEQDDGFECSGDCSKCEHCFEFGGDEEVDQWYNDCEISGEDEEWFIDVNVGEMVYSEKYFDGIVMTVRSDGFSVAFDDCIIVAYDFDGVNFKDDNDALI
jgi:hypothetical protein